ncbi:MAG: hypothetical protein WDW38_008572 [Sanguina aurantia]
MPQTSQKEPEPSFDQVYSCTAATTQEAAFEAQSSFRPDDYEDLRLPLECQQLLGLRAGVFYSDSDINSAFDELARSEVEPGYSTYALQSRQELLDIARHDLIANKSSRGGAGGQPRPRELSIPADLASGVLALLVEVGPHTLVLSLGNELLRSIEFSSMQQQGAGSKASAAPQGLQRNDVVLSMALAHCGFADQLLVNQEVSNACAELEEAVRLLHSTGQPPVSPALARQISEGLASIQLQRILEVLCLPLPHANTPASNAPAPAASLPEEERRHALRCLRDAIRVASSAAPASPGSRSEGALGSGSGGGTGGRGLRSTLHATAVAGPSVAAAVLTEEFLEAAVQQLSSEELVHLQEWESVAKAKAVARTWVYPGLLPAVAVAHVVHGYLARQPAYLKSAARLLQQQPESPDMLAVRAKAGAAAAATAPRDDGSLPSAAQAYAFVERASAAGDEGLLPGLCLFTERWLAKAAFPFFRDTASSPPRASLPTYFNDTRVETLLTVYDEKPANPVADTLAALQRLITQQATGNDAAPPPTSPPGTPSFPRVATLLGLAALAVAGVAVAVSRAVAPAPAGGEFASPDGDVRGGTDGAGGVVVVGRGQGGELRRPGRGPADQEVAGSSSLTSRPLPHRREAPSSVSPSQGPSPVGQQTKNMKQACSIRFPTILSVSDAKALSTGPSHQTSSLPLLLSQPFLSEAMARAEQSRAEGWVMSFKLWKLQVKSVDSSNFSQHPASSGLPSYGYLTVTASLDESATLHGRSDGGQSSGYRSSYDAQYRVVQAEDGSWRVAQVTVLEESRDTAS